MPLSFHSLSLTFFHSVGHHHTLPKTPSLGLSESESNSETLRGHEWYSHSASVHINPIGGICIIPSRGQINNPIAGNVQKLCHRCGTDTKDITWCDGEKRPSPQGDSEMTSEERTLSLNRRSEKVRRKTPSQDEPEPMRMTGHSRVFTDVLTTELCLFPQAPGLSGFLYHHSTGIKNWSLLVRQIWV